ncbi:MAG: endonuclease/exonuclease/phosphatase family protein [Gemmataceae bacterium]
MPPRLRLFALLPLAAGVLALATLAPAQPPRARTYLFCFWNVENLFDDRVNPKLEKVDREFDDYFAKNREALEKKLDRLTEVLLGPEVNGGNGPDILALAEVESLRAVELVRDALNRRLRDKALHYRTAVYRDPQGGRSIATAVLSRVPVDEKRTRLLGRYQRILRVHLLAGRSELVVIASHWTSRVSDKAGRGRSGYARQIHDDFVNAYRSNPAVDYLVCGDFNDTPADPAVVNDLAATGDLKRVLGLTRQDRPLFYNPFAELAQKGKGTHAFGDRPFVFDQVCLSPGLLDGEGWSYVNRSAAIIEKFTFRGRPDRFGGPADRRPWRNRGASDHYPVTIQLRAPAAS